MSLKYSAIALIAVFIAHDSAVGQRKAAPIARGARVARPASPDEPKTKRPQPPTDGSDSDEEVDPEKAAAEKKAEHEKQRLAKIKNIKFDRRPSVILKTWSTPFKTLAQIAEEKKQEAEKKKPVKPPVEDLKAASNEDPMAEPAEPDPLAEEMQAFDESLHKLKYDVTLSNWAMVNAFMQTLKSAESEALYTQLLASLQRPVQSVPSDLIRFAEKNVFSLDDVLALIELTPQPLSKSTTASLGCIIRVSLTAGNSLNDLVEKLHGLTDRELPPDTKPEDIKVDKRKVAAILMSAGETIRAGDFLPKPDEAIKAVDRESLNLLSRYFLAMHAKEKKKEFLEQAWQVTQAALAAGEITDEQKQESLKRAVELAPKIKAELGQAWLNESFTTRPERGMEILATIGSAVATGLVTKSGNPTLRQKELELQNTAVQALLKASPDRATEWSKTLNLLAANWLKEAEHSRVYDGSSSRGPALNRDVYGNYFYSQYRYSSRMMDSSSSPTPQAVASGKLLDIKPDSKWLEHIDPPMQPKFVTILPQLHLKVNEEDKAFPYIELLSKTNPEIAKDLAEEFLRVWTTNHDPNSTSRRTSMYMFSYGFNRRAQGIPLTRSKQVRNMKELSEWVARIRELPIGEIDERILTNAFTNTHGAAEVYKLEDIEAVFGSLENLKPQTLASLLQKMRSNLSSVWRLPATQKNAGTNRKKKDIEAEVLRGYLVANRVLDEAIKAHPESWELHLARAAVKHDENNYHQELEQSSEYIAKRQDSMNSFKECAEMYAKTVETIGEEKWSALAFENWFYASLGDSDLGKLKKDKLADLKQMPIIREAILALPGETAEKHMGMFANSLFTRLSSVNPGVKFRYLRAGFEIVKDHKRAEEARIVFDYYKDLVTEIKLETVIDGNDKVGHEEPFGVFINLHHTSAIERESGGFAKYLQNQNNQYYSYNYGRPTENYRDKFEESLTQALSEQFEVRSVTFQREDVNSRATSQEGWRVTPYAYVLLKARGPEVDKIPSVQLDLDFLDTSGYAVIPVESAEVPIDAVESKGDARPIEKISLTQTLDERQSKDGKLILEIKGTGQGLVPALDDLLDLNPKEFDVVDIQDEGVAVSQFDKEAEDNVVVSERNWIVTLHAKDGLKEHPKSFEFAKPKLETDESIYQRYVDADLASVESQISLEQQYGEPSNAFIWWIVGGLVVGLAILVCFILMPKPEVKLDRVKFAMPEEVTPFTVLGLLKNIQTNNGLSSSGQQELTTTINRVEEYYFFDQGDAPDLGGIAREWVAKAR
jgi:hypothetical protein